ncbi:MAG: hypothetical protein EBT95_01875 [Verrucomicrobia bacterium]|nr:hypothetical protein [Verrucomicrobiota bacterium]
MNAKKIRQDSAGNGGQQGGEEEAAGGLPCGEDIDGISDTWEVVVGEVETNGDGLEEKKDTIVVADGEQAGAGGFPQGPGGGQAFRPRRMCRSRRFVWPWG